MRPKPGDIVEYTQTFRGVVVRTHSNHIHIRNKKFTTQILEDQIVRIIDPQPDKDEVIKIVRCSGCGSVGGQRCKHKQSGKYIKHPHKERIETYIKVTGWSPNDDDQE